MSGLTTADLDREAERHEHVSGYSPNVGDAPGFCRRCDKEWPCLGVDIIAAARLPVAIDELPLPEGWTLTVERMSHGRYMAWAEPMHDRNNRMTGATGPTMLAAVLALGVALRSRA
jgi:hypothetical protein